MQIKGEIKTTYFYRKKNGKRSLRLVIIFIENYLWCPFTNEKPTYYSSLVVNLEI